MTQCHEGLTEERTKWFRLTPFPLVRFSMSKFPILVSAALVTALLSGCGSSQPKAPPSRPLLATFSAATTGDVKTQLMAACAKNGLRVQSTELTVTCTRTTDAYYRDLMMNRVIDDEYATNIRELIVFDLIPRGNDVRVVGRTYAQYTAPVSLTAANEVRKRDLVDDETYILMQNLIRMTKGVE